MSKTYEDLMLLEQFNQYADITIQELDKIIISALNSSAGIAVDNIKAQVSSSFPFLTSSSGKHGYTVPLIEGVQPRKALSKYANPYSKATILGSKTNDGTWRLRFFETGTYGGAKIQSSNFFESGFNASISAIEQNIAQKLQVLENKINSENQ